MGIPYSVQMRYHVPMKIDGRTLSKEKKALVRRMAVQRVWDGEKPIAVMDSYGLARQTVFLWLRKAEEQGLDALALRPHKGRKRELSEQEG